MAIIGKSQPYHVNQSHCHSSNQINDARQKPKRQLFQELLRTCSVLSVSHLQGTACVLARRYINYLAPLTLTDCPLNDDGLSHPYLLI